MSTQEEKIAAVTVGVNAYADVETELEALKGKFDTLIQSIDECYAIGIGRQGEHLKIINKLQKAKGEIAGALATVIEAHETSTGVVQREGCDVALPATYAIGTVSPMSGSR